MAGSSNGLSLTLNVEQYEYMTGPNHAAGLKILLVGQDDVAFVEELGDSVPTGQDSIISINTIKARFLVKQNLQKMLQSLSMFPFYRLQIYPLPMEHASQTQDMDRPNAMMLAGQSTLLKSVGADIST